MCWELVLSSRCRPLLLSNVACRPGYSWAVEAVHKEVDYTAAGCLCVTESNPYLSSSC